MHHLGRHAVVLGALRMSQRMVNDGAVAVLHLGPTPPALAHGPFIAPLGDDPRLPRWLAPAEFVQAVVVDAEVVGDLVDDRDRHLVDHLVVVLADVEQRIAVDRDRVR